MTTDAQKLAAALTKKLVDDGMIIEGGFASLRILSIPPDASDIQVHDMRMAFFAGAHHLFASIMSVLDAGTEPTDADLRRIDLISAELDRFIEVFKAERRPAGNA
jgi:hypothetical protein